MANDLKKMQKLLLFMMKRIHEVCVKHNIKYWIDYGSLLGAIRHNGFIPWDDDMDICMMREDYNRFCQIAPQELGEDFFVQTSDLDPSWVVPFGKVRLNGTAYHEGYFKCFIPGNRGFFIDIFPFDFIPENKILQKLTFGTVTPLCAIQRYKMLKIAKNKIFKFLYSCCAPLLPMKILVKIFLLFVDNNIFAPRKSSLVSQLALTDCQRNIIPADYKENLILHKFEDTEFFIPENYDARLTALYGDYMTPPPENERNPHHDIIFIDYGKYENIC